MAAINISPSNETVMDLSNTENKQTDPDKHATHFAESMISLYFSVLYYSLKFTYSAVQFKLLSDLHCSNQVE